MYLHNVKQSVQSFGAELHVKLHLGMTLENQPTPKRRCIIRSMGYPTKDLQQDIAYIFGTVTFKIFTSWNGLSFFLSVFTFSIPCNRDKFNHFLKSMQNELIFGYSYIAHFATHSCKIHQNCYETNQSQANKSSVLQLAMCSFVQHYSVRANKYLDNIHAFHYSAKNCVLIVQPWCCNSGDKKLRPISVWASISH